MGVEVVPGLYEGATPILDRDKRLTGRGPHQERVDERGGSQRKDEGDRFRPVWGLCGEWGVESL